MRVQCLYSARYKLRCKRRLKYHFEYFFDHLACLWNLGDDAAPILTNDNYDALDEIEKAVTLLSHYSYLMN